MEFVAPNSLMNTAVSPLAEVPLPPLVHRRILLVEDLPEPTRAVAQALREAGAEVVLECHASAAVALIQRSPQPFDAVVLDLQWSPFETLDAVRRMRQSGYDRTILGVIPSDEPLMGKILHSAGCSVILPRPLEPGKLVTTLNLASAEHSGSIAPQSTGLDRALR